MENERKINEQLFFALMGVLFIVMIVWSVKSSKVESSGFAENLNVETITSNWYLYREDVEGSQKVYVPDEFDIEAGETWTLKRLLTDIDDGDAICFRTLHTSVRVLVDNEEIYSFGWGKNIPIGDSPGNAWHVIEFDKEYQSKTLVIELNCPYEKYAGKMQEIYSGTASDIYLYVNETTSSSYTTNYILLIIGVVLILACLFGWFFIKMKQLLFLGIYLVVNAVWGFAESGHLQFVFGNAYMTHVINYVMFMLLPITMVMALNSINLIQKHFGIVYGVAYSCAVVPVFLQLYGIKDLHEMVSVVHLSIIGICGIILYDNYVEYKSKKLNDFGYLLTAFIVLSSSLVFDMFIFYTFGSDNNGYFFRLGSFAFVLILGMWAIQQALRIYKESAKKEAIVKMAYTDNLTGLLNRRSFDDELREVELGKIKALIVMIDLNNLKTINDTLGHQKGDAAIRAISDRIKIFHDKYGENCYRTGGDEFCVICRHITVNDVVTICEDINKQLMASNEVQGARLSMAYGYKVYDPYMYDTVEQVVKQADEQMYLKKQKMKQEMAAQNQK